MKRRCVEIAVAKVCLAAVLLFCGQIAAAPLDPGALQKGVASAPPTTAPATGAMSPLHRTLRLPDLPYRYDIDLPDHFQTAAARRSDDTASYNRVTDAGAALGRALFYDTRLSANNTISCGSCHVQKHAFSDPRRFSKGFAGQLGDRNAMSLVNARFNPDVRFFWDERAPNLEEQVLFPIQSKGEMGQDLDRLIELLAADEQYPELFAKAFGTPRITRQFLARALAQFVRSLVSFQSTYDQGLATAGSARADFGNFTAQENRGKNLFMRNCSTCHMSGGQAAHFVMNRAMNNGLDLDLRTGDGGVGDLTLRGSDVGRFRSPSLRNIEYTAPYMHDGRFATLEAVVDHYSTGVQPNPNLDPRARRLNLTPAQKADVVAFLKTLSDRNFISDPRYSDPFDPPMPVVQETPVAPAADRPVRRDVITPSAGRVGNDRGPRGLGADAVVARVMGYDRNVDGLVARSELPERMQSLIEAIDTNGDDALDKGEIERAASAQSNGGGRDGFAARTFDGRAGRGRRIADPQQQPSR